MRPASSPANERRAARKHPGAATPGQKGKGSERNEAPQGNFTTKEREMQHEILYHKPRPQDFFHRQSH